MSETKKTRPAGGTAGAGRGMETKTACEAVTFSDFYSTTPSANVQGIFDLLPQGEQNAISSKSLAELVGVASVRELQSVIAQERDNGALILSTCRGGGGYFRPSPGDKGRAEIERYIATLRARALNTLRILRSAKAAVATAEVAGQVDMDDLGVM